jgi:hypothetical protein
LWDADAQNYSSAVWFGTASQWSPNLVAAPGKAFFIQAVSTAGTLNITFVGDVPQGHLVNDLTPGPGLSLVSSIVPQAATLDALGFPGEFLDTVFLWDVDGTIGGIAQNYVAQVNFGGVGTWSPDNQIKVAQGFFVQKADTSTQNQWVRDFSVN